jgi:hypothetical protein
MSEKRVNKPAKRAKANTRKKKPLANGFVNDAELDADEIWIDVGRPPSPLRGLMPTPPEVAELMARIERERPMSDAARQRQMDWFNEQYYFGGNWIAYRHTPKGEEVLAVGWDEIGRLERKRMSKAARESIVLGYVEPW